MATDRQVEGSAFEDRPTIPPVGVDEQPRNPLTNGELNQSHRSSSSESSGSRRSISKLPREMSETAPAEEEANLSDSNVPSTDYSAERSEQRYTIDYDDDRSSRLQDQHKAMLKGIGPGERGVSSPAQSSSWNEQASRLVYDIQYGPISETTQEDLRERCGVSAKMKVSLHEDVEVEFRDVLNTQDQSRHFAVGKVFDIPWAAALDEEGDIDMPSCSMEIERGDAEPQLLRLIAIQDSEKYCSAVSLLDRVESSNGASTVAFISHAMPPINDSIRLDNDPAAQNQGQIWIDSDHQDSLLTAVAHIYLKSVFTIDHRIPAQSFGVVRQSCIRGLLRQFWDAWYTEPTTTPSELDPDIKQEALDPGSHVPTQSFPDASLEPKLDNNQSSSSTLDLSDKIIFGDTASNERLLDQVVERMDSQQGSTSPPFGDNTRHKIIYHEISTPPPQEQLENNSGAQNVSKNDTATDPKLQAEQSSTTMQFGGANREAVRAEFDPGAAPVARPSAPLELDHERSSRRTLNPLATEVKLPAFVAIQPNHRDFASSGTGDFSQSMEKQEASIKASLGLQTKAVQSSDIRVRHRTEMQAAAQRDKRLYSTFKRNQRPKHFFVVGRVFITLWVEPVGEIGSGTGSSPTAITSRMSTGMYGERVFSKIRRFVVVREGEESCTALPIMTYGGLGVARKGVQKNEHAIIFSSKKPPKETEEERAHKYESGLLPRAIRVDTDDIMEKLDPMSRLDFGKAYTIQHSIRVRSIGMIHAGSQEAFLYSFRSIWGRKSKKQHPPRTQIITSPRPEREERPRSSRDPRMSSRQNTTSLPLKPRSFRPRKVNTTSDDNPTERPASVTNTEAGSSGGFELVGSLHTLHDQAREAYYQRSGSFFQRHLIFEVKRHDPAQSNGLSNGYHHISTRPVEDKPEYFVVIGTTDRFSLCLLISYDQSEAATASNVRAAHRAVIYSSEDSQRHDPPSDATRVPLQVHCVGSLTISSPAPRLDYARICTIEHNVEVRTFGWIARSSRAAFDYDQHEVYRTITSVNQTDNETDVNNQHEYASDGNGSSSDTDSHETDDIV